MPPPIDIPVLGAAYRLVNGYPGGAQALDARMGKPLGTLSQQVCERGTAKLSLKDALTISRLAGDLDILQTFAAELGCMVLPVPPMSPRGDGIALMTKAARMAQMFAALMGEVLESSADGQISDNERQRIEEAWAQLVSDGSAVVAAVRESNELLRRERGLMTTTAGEGTA